MLTATTWYGGSESFTSHITLGWSSPRFIRSQQVVVGMTVTLPDLTYIQLNQVDRGGWRFIIVRDSTPSATVKDAQGNTIGTIANGEAGLIAVYDDGGTLTWKMIVRTVGASRSVGHSTIGTLVEKTTPTTYDPDDLFCFIGDDCEFAAADPLDGQDGRATVVLPMFQNACNAANDNREAVRAADIIMPSAISLRILPGCFELDTNHPLTATLSDGFWEAMENGGNPHRLEYSAADKLYTTSRNPYHVRSVWDALSWTYGTVTCHKHFWKKTIEYEDEDGNTFNLDLVFQAEHTVDPEPTLWAEAKAGSWAITNITAGNPVVITVPGHNFETGDCVNISGTATVPDINAQHTCTVIDSDTITVPVNVSSVSIGTGLAAHCAQGGRNDTDEGLWGTLFMLYIFTDEIDPTFFEGDSYTPAGAAAPVTFWRHDPLAWGQATGISEGADDKFGHPQLMAAAALATTLHSPCLSRWVPPQLRDEIPPNDIQGWNRALDYRRPNCLPWITDPTRDLNASCADCATAPRSHQITHFSHDNDTGAGSDPLAGMTLGGDLPYSRPSEHLCWENGAGIGRTFLKPSSAGWDEEIGELTSGSCTILSLCIDWNNNWEEYPFNTCDGHPAELFNDIGGTHSCYKNMATGSDTQCCIAYEDATGTWRQKCVRDHIKYGNRQGNSCEVLDLGCSEVGTYTTVKTLGIYSYDLGPVTNPVTLREIEWRRYEVDPDAILYSYTYDSGDVGDIDQDLGTWSLGASAITVTPASAKTVSALLMYDPTRVGGANLWRDATCYVQFQNCDDVTHGIGMRMYLDGSNDANGYGAYIEPTGASTANAVIARYDAGVETVLASKAIVLEAPVVDVTFRAWGTTLHFGWEVSGGLAESLEVDDCTYDENKGPTLFTKTTAAQASFADWVIVDESYQFAGGIDTGSFFATFSGAESMTVSGQEALMDGYGLCTDMSEYCCGQCCDPQCCNCTVWIESMNKPSGFIANWAGPGDVDGLPAPTDPTYCAGPFFDQDCYKDWCDNSDQIPCGDCPKPYPCVSLCIATRCFEDDPSLGSFHYLAADEPNICRGITKWCTGDINCV